MTSAIYLAIEISPDHLQMNAYSSEDKALRACLVMMDPSRTLPESEEEVKSTFINAFKTQTSESNPYVRIQKLAVDAVSAEELAEHRQDAKNREAYVTALEEQKKMKEGKITEVEELMVELNVDEENAGSGSEADDES